MAANRMLYRVFLLDEKDAPGPIDKPENNFRIRLGYLNASVHSNPNWQPSIEEQLRAMDFGSRVGPSLEPLDGHFLIEHQDQFRSVIGIVHSVEEIPEKSYFLAREKAMEMAVALKEKGWPYVLIDVTSRGDRTLAEKLVSQINIEYIETGCVSGNPALCADIE